MDPFTIIMIYRSFNGNNLKMYASVKAGEKEFNDYAIPKKGTYKYSIRAVYPDGGKSPMTKVKEVVYGAVIALATA